LPKELIDACLQHSLSSKSLTLKVGNFNLNLMQLRRFNEGAKKSGRESCLQFCMEQKK
jgi:hypothetical protein